MMKFKCFDWREKTSQSFDPEKITLKMGNKEFNVYDMIQQNREDTEITETLLKYGSIDKMILNKEELYEDFTIMEKQRSLADQIKYADNMFYTLPYEMRQEFNNNKYEFMKRGKEWIEKKIEEERKVNAENNSNSNTSNEPSNNTSNVA